MLERRKLFNQLSPQAKIEAGLLALHQRLYPPRLDFWKFHQYEINQVRGDLPIFIAGYPEDFDFFYFREADKVGSIVVFDDDQEYFHDVITFRGDKIEDINDQTLELLTRPTRLRAYNFGRTVERRWKRYKKQHPQQSPIFADQPPVLVQT